jgi:hypothetical protein
MESFDWVVFIVVAISMAELAIQIATSELSGKLKRVLRLNIPYDAKLKVLGGKKLWEMMFGSWWFIAAPVMLLARLHEFFSEMLDCPFCCGFWIMLAVNLFYLNMTLATGVILAPVALAVVAILDRIHCG